MSDISQIYYPKPHQENKASVLWDIRLTRHHINNNCDNGRKSNLKGASNCMILDPVTTYAFFRIDLRNTSDRLRTLQKGFLSLVKYFL